MAERTCIGCGRKAPRDALVRIVVSSAAGRATVDDARTAPGRGAWLCPSLTCFDRAVKRKAFGRALRAALGASELDRLRTEFGELVSGQRV